MLRFAAMRLTGQQISLPAFGITAIVVCGWYSGAGPAVLASILTTAWYIADSQGSESSMWIYVAVYLLEAAAVCACSRYLHAEARKAAQGEDWRRHLVETAAEGIWTVDSGGVIRYANPRMAEILGFTADDLLGRNVEEFLFPADIPGERIRFQNRHQIAREQFDRRLRRADGSEVWMLACSSLFRHDGKDPGLLTMMTDITERRKAEHALRQSERKFRELFENIREGVYQTAPDGRILAANPELLRMLGFSDRAELDVPGVVRDTFIDPELHKQLRERLERDGSYANVEFPLRTRDLRSITVRENARVVRDERGDVLYYEGTLTDITEQIKLEKQLRQAQKAEAMGRLAGGIAQDFRAIGMGAMKELQQALDGLPADSPARHRLQSVAQSLEGAAGLTRQILEFSRNQARDHEITDINGVVRGLDPFIRVDAATEIALEFSLCPEPAPVRADSGHLSHILSHWAIPAAGRESAGRKIEVSTSIEASGPEGNAGPFVCITVCAAKGNTGKGVWNLSPSAGGREVGHERPDPASARTSADGADPDGTHVLAPDTAPVGTGTAQAILAQYGGAVTSSNSGGVFRCSLFLPLAFGVDRSILSAGTPSHSVLLVEEEPLVRELSRDMLERQGFRVLTAGNAAEARRIANGPAKIDVLIIDWTAGGRHHAELVRLLRELRPELRVLFVAGYADSSLDSVRAPDGTAILQKPFSGESLARRVRQLLEGPRKGKSASSLN
jgi:PAS domain S-box-containing protein